MMRERSPEGGEGESSPEEGPPRGADPWWSRQLVASVVALALMATVTLVTIVASPLARAGSRPPAARSTQPVPLTTTTQDADYPASATAPAPGGSAPGTAPPSTATAPATTPTAPAGTPATTPAGTTAPPAPTAAPDPATALARAVEAVPGSGTGKVSVGIADLDGTARATYDSDRDDPAYDTASIVKVDILAALLLRHQHAGTEVTGHERDLATDMIEVSDNDAAEALWETVGGDSGLAAANATLGLRHTVGGPGDLWGLTQTTVADQLTLLRAVFGGAGSPLSAASRDYMTKLMTSISDGQRWGVSAADSDAAGYALKNGWLRRTATGRWDVNSIGLVTHDGRRLLICVLSSGQPSEQQGIDLVRAAAVAAAKSLPAGPA